jgi:uncharacterized protein (DUF433 family)
VKTAQELMRHANRRLTGRVRVVPSIVKIDALAAQFGYFSERQHVTRRAFSNTRWRLSRRGEKQMEKLDRITTDPARMSGEPCIRNLRLTVRRVLEALAIYPDRGELKREHPELEDEVRGGFG